MGAFPYVEVCFAIEHNEANEPSFLGIALTKYIDAKPYTVRCQTLKHQQWRPSRNHILFHHRMGW